jgi:hypothetical protein
VPPPLLSSYTSLGASSSAAVGAEEFTAKDGIHMVVITHILFFIEVTEGYDIAVARRP